MASKFSCSLRYSDALKLKNTCLVYCDGSDEYRVKYRSNVCRDLILSIEWTIPKQVLVTVKLYCKKFRKCLLSKGNVVNGCKTFMKLRGGFNICSSPDYAILCLINFMPFVQFKEYIEECTGSDNILEKNNYLAPVGKLSLEMNNESGGTSVDTIEEKYFERSQANRYKSPDKITEMLRNEFITNGTHPYDDKVTVNSQVHAYKVETNEVFANINSCVKLEAENAQYKSYLLGDISGTEIKNNIDKAIEINSVLKSDSPVIIEEQEFAENCNLSPNTEDFDMLNIEDLNVQKAEQKTGAHTIPCNVNLPEISSNNQDNLFRVNTKCNEIENDYSNLLISNDVSLNKGTVLDIRSVGMSNDKNNVTIGNTRDITDIESNATQIKKDVPIEFKAQNLSNNVSSSLLNDVDGTAADNAKTNSHETLFEEIDLTMENESLELSEDKDILMLCDVNEMKSEMKMDFQTELSSNKAYENKETVKISSTGEINIALNKRNSTVKNKKMTNAKKLMAEEDALNKSDSGIDLNVEDYASGHNKSSLKANIENPKGTKSCILSETNSNTKVEKSENKQELFSSNSELSFICREDPVEYVQNSSTKDLIENEELNLPSTDKCSSKSEKIENSEIYNTNSNDIQLIEFNNTITHKIPVSGFQQQCSSISKLITPTVTDSSATNTSVTKDNQAVSNVFTAKVNLVSENLTKKYSAQLSRNTSAKSSGNAKRNLVSKLSKSTLSTNALTKELPVMETRLKGLSMNMLDLLMSGNMSDAVISNGKREIKVHKAILSSRSSVFKKIFTELAEGSLENRVHVNVPSYIIEDMVVFMYAGLVNIKSKKMADDLHRIAKKYCIKDLIEICSKYISK